MDIVKMFAFICLCVILAYLGKLFVKAQKRKSIEETENYPVFNRVRASKSRNSRPKVARWLQEHC